MGRKVTSQSIIASNWPPPIWNRWPSSRGLSAIAELLVVLDVAYSHISRVSLKYRKMCTLKRLFAVLLCVGLFSCNIRVYTVVCCFHVDLKAVTRTSRQCFWLALLCLVLLGVDNTSSQLGIDHNERQCTTDTVTIWWEVHYRTPGQQAERWRRRERCWMLFLVCHEHSLFWVFLGHFPMLLCKNYGMNQKIGKKLALYACHQRWSQFEIQPLLVKAVGDFGSALIRVFMRLIALL